jgi:hypothetical protein
MDLKKRIAGVSRLVVAMNQDDEEVKEIAERAYQFNKWFTTENIFRMMRNVCDQFLQRETLEEWMAYYSFPENLESKTVGIVMAGNIPMVGFHDLLCVLISGHKALIKVSSKDDVLIPWLLKKLVESDEEWKYQFAISDLLKNMDAAIATGSNNSSRYFEYYFGKYRHIIRKNRGSVAVLTGNESKEELFGLGTDIFSYFGLGCRNVSKLFVPEGYDPGFFLEAMSPFRYVIDHNKYKNNYDYNRTLLLMNNEPHLANDFLMLKQDGRIVSPVAMVHYEFYKNEMELKEKLVRDENNIQCIAGRGFIPFGQTQSPALGDYADHVDTMKFLVSL